MYLFVFSYKNILNQKQLRWLYYEAHTTAIVFFILKPIDVHMFSKKYNISLHPEQMTKQLKLVFSDCGTTWHKSPTNLYIDTNTIHT